jgi:hypothetical protein
VTGGRERKGPRTVSVERQLLELSDDGWRSTFPFRVIVTRRADGRVGRGIGVAMRRRSVDCGGRVRGFEVCEWRRGGLEASRMASSGVRQSESTAHGRVQRQTRGIAAEGALATGGRTQVTGAMEAWCSFEEEKTRERLNDSTRLFSALGGLSSGRFHSGEPSSQPRPQGKRKPARCLIHLIHLIHNDCFLSTVEASRTNALPEPSRSCCCCCCCTNYALALVVPRRAGV